MVDSFDNSIAKKIGENLRRIIVSRKLTQREAADVVGINYRVMQKYINAEIVMRVEPFLNLVEKLDVSPSELLPENKANKSDMLIYDEMYEQNDTSMEAIGYRLRTARMARGLSLKTVSQMAGIALGTVRNCELAIGQISISSLLRVAIAIEVPYIFLIGLSEKEEKHRIIRYNIDIK
ncbi:MAG: hypothetical protein WCQ87_10450 [Parabacteroides sp.]